MNRDGTVPIDVVERELLLEAYDRYPATLVVERKMGDSDARHVAALKLQKKGLLTWKSVEAGAGTGGAHMRSEYALTDPGVEVARVTGAS